MKPSTIRIVAAQMESVFESILLQYGCAAEIASKTAHIFTINSIEGVYSHGVNRFARLISYIQKGWVDPAATIQPVATAGAIEQWNGNNGIGPLLALSSTERAMELARLHGMGCVGLRHSNHWMRGGLYGWHAAQGGFAFIGFSNTIANMPAWPGNEKRLGNNPLVIALPYAGEAVVLDMAMSQYSYGALQVAATGGSFLPVPGGYDETGALSRDASRILEKGTVLPAGFWKGSSLALLLDMLAVLLSGGASTMQITAGGQERGLSQVFICIDLGRFHEKSSITALLRQIIQDYQATTGGQDAIRYPGEKAVKTREENGLYGIPVDSNVWKEILDLMPSSQPNNGL